MLRRSVRRLGGGWAGGPAKGVVPFHEWHLRETEIVNYEGWRILDNVEMSLTAAYTYDLGGVGRHLDPIIDDPRLTHTQRVCRLYRWSLREMMHWLTFTHPEKFNLGYKVVRARFEKYRYVTDPAMCDMMIRETQAYLREVCSPAMLRQDGHSPGMPGHLRDPMFHPDSSRVYDHWTHPEVYLYDDLKLHKYLGHHPNNSVIYAPHDRFGVFEEVAYPWLIMRVFVPVVSVWFWLWVTGAMYIQIHEDDPRFEHVNSHVDLNLRKTLEAEERHHRGPAATAETIWHDWAYVLGSPYRVVGDWSLGNKLAPKHDGPTPTDVKGHSDSITRKNPNFKFEFERDY